jgi:hypothetical protein
VSDPIRVAIRANGLSLSRSGQQEVKVADQM